MLLAKRRFIEIITLKERIIMLRQFSGPIIGAIIGYCTNYIAVKMLFYPRKPIYLCGRQLPFTPGAIPKGKDRGSMTFAATTMNMGMMCMMNMCTMCVAKKLKLSVHESK